MEFVNKIHISTFIYEKAANQLESRAFEAPFAFFSGTQYSFRQFFLLVRSLKSEQCIRLENSKRLAKAVFSSAMEATSSY